VKSLVSAAWWVLVLSVSGAAASESEQPLPYTLGVHVEFGTPKGPDSVRDEIQRRVVHNLAPRGWFTEIVEWEQDDRTPVDLLLQVTLDDLRRETHYDTSMAERRDDADPLSKQQFTVDWEVVISVDLFLMPEGIAVRSSRFKETNSRRPRYLGEDTEAAIRDEAIRDVANSIRRAAFKGSLQKLERKIDQAREKAAAEAR
jgi:hypothetical protein